MHLCWILVCLALIHITAEGPLLKRPASCNVTVLVHVEIWRCSCMDRCHCRAAHDCTKYTSERACSLLRAQSACDHRDPDKQTGCLCISLDDSPLHHRALLCAVIEWLLVLANRHRIAENTQQLCLYVRGARELVTKKFSHSGAYTRTRARSLTCERTTSLEFPHFPVLTDLPYNVKETASFEHASHCPFKAASSSCRRVAVSDAANIHNLTLPEQSTTHLHARG